MTRTDILTAYVVLRALGYLLPERWTTGQWDPWMAEQLRAFQAAANREQGKRLRVDGILGDDSLNALAWYGSRPPASLEVRGDGLPAGEWANVARVILARKDRPWGLGTGRAPAPAPRPQPQPQASVQPATPSAPVVPTQPQPQAPTLNVTLETMPWTASPTPQFVDGVLVPVPVKPAEGLSTGAKVALGVGVGVLVVGGVLAVRAARARRAAMDEG